VDFLTFLQQLVNGLSLGSLYALIAIGYTLVYGILRLINFAHGDLLMVAAYIAVMGVGVFSLPWPLAFGLAIGLTGFMGVMIERGAYRPLRRAPRISLLISAIAASFLLENLALVIFGGRAKPFPVPKIFAGSFVWDGLFIPRLSLFIPVITALLLVGLFIIINRTAVGRAMRAISRDLETVSLMGINVNRIIAFTFLVGSLLAGAGGLLWAMKYPEVNPFMGIMPGLKAFIAAVLGGIGNVTGAVLGGLLLGLLEVMIVAFFPAWAGYRDAVAFTLLIVLLLVRPTGLLGEDLSEEKL
jgi:branched-chain amino acid transport system permease protein